MNRSRYEVIFNDDGYIAIIKDNDENQEVVGWGKEEYTEEDLTLTIANAVKLAYTDPKELLSIVGKSGDNLPY